MLRVCLALLVSVLPLQALALSCLPWQMEDAYADADASSKPFVIVSGTLFFSPDDLPQVDWDRQQDVPPETRIDARMVGTALFPGENAEPFNRPVTLVVECAGPWCPQLSADAEYLAFLEQSEAGYVLTVGACGGMAFGTPDADLLDRLRSCLAGGECTGATR